MLDDIRVITHLDGPYLVAGTRAYLIGQMDGTFPSYGDHIPGAMTGLWRHPNKLLREIRMGWAAPGMAPQWPRAQTFVRHAWAVDQLYSLTEWLSLTRTFWVPDGQPGVVMEITVENGNDKEESIGLFLGWVSDLHPGWLDETPRGHDIAYSGTEGLLFRNSISSWWVSCVADAFHETRIHQTTAVNDLTPECAAATTVHYLTIPSAGTARVTYWIYGGDGNPNSLVFPDNLERWRVAKQIRYEQLLETAAISIPDSELARALEWMKLQADWLMRTVPGLGTGLGAGVPEYPWWFACDTNYAIKGVLAFGQYSWAQDTLTLLKNASERTNGNGRIVHEVSTTGIVYHRGNMQETPQFVDAVWETFCWTGDINWLTAMYPSVAAAMEWVLSQDPSGYDLASGYGIIEIEAVNLRMLDTAVYTHAGLRAYAAIANIMGDADLSRELNMRAERLQVRILTLFWMEEHGLFADFLASESELGERVSVWTTRADRRGQVDAAARYNQLPFAPRDGGQSAYLMKNWIISTPMEMGIAPETWAKRALSNMRQSKEFQGPYGLYLSGTDQREMMTISTGVQAVAEIRYGNADSALAWMRDIAKTMGRRSPGTISEMSPDSGCFVQAWTAYGLWYPLVTGFFGILPKAWRCELTFRPIMPTSWARASIERLRVGTNYVHCDYARRDGYERYRLTTEEPWDILFGRDLELRTMDGGALVDSGHVHLQSNGSVTFHKVPTRG